MDKKMIISMLEENTLLDISEAIEEIKATFIKKDLLVQSEYDKYHSYYYRYKNGNLGKKGLNDLLTRFGFEPVTTLVKRSEKGKPKIPDSIATNDKK